MAIGVQVMSINIIINILGLIAKVPKENLGLTTHGIIINTIVSFVMIVFIKKSK